MKYLDQEKLAINIQNRARADLEACNIGGSSVLVAQGDEILFKEHFGDEEIFRPSDDSLFRIASMTKPITAVAIMILKDRELLSLEDDVARFYGKFFSMRLMDGQETPEKIKIKHLLTHTSGIGSGEAWTEANKKMTEEDRSTVEKFVDFWTEQPLAFVPGSQQAYSAVAAFSVLTGIVQKITDMPFSDFLKKEIFDPCHMKDTTFEPTEEQWRRLVPMHDKQNGKNAVRKTVEHCVFEGYPTQNYLGGGGLISSLSDYLNFAKMLMGGGAFAGNRILSEDSVKEMSQPLVPRSTDFWGYSVRVVAEEGRPLPRGSYGWSGAYGSHFWIDPSNKIIGIYMKNSRFDGGSGAKTSKNFEKDVYSCLSE